MRAAGPPAARRMPFRPRRTAAVRTLSARPTRGAGGVRTLLLAGIALSLVLPKLLLIDFVNLTLGGAYGPGDLPFVLAQDLLLAALVFAALGTALHRGSPGRILAAAGTTGLLLLVLMVDARARQLWLKPINLELAGYALEHAAELASGHELFLNHQAGWGMTFRRSLFVVELGLGVLWLGAGLGPWRRSRRRRRAPSAWRRRALGSLLLVAAPAALALRTPALPYALESNILVEPWVGRLRPMRAEQSELQELASSFEEPHRPLGDVLGAHPRVILQGARPFSNLVLVFLESVRWRGLGLEAGGTATTRAPNLRRLADEGLVARTYVSLPHSSKAYFTILTGRHPYPGLEIREATVARHASLIWLLRERLSHESVVFSSMFLPLENVDGMLAAIGFDRRLEPRHLRNGRPPEAADAGWGVSDEILAVRGPEVLGRTGSPFVALFLPYAAHHPYPYPGKPADDSNGIESYWRSVEFLDRQLARLLDELDHRALLEDTLLVLVGDHGESFGQHGTFVHNSSMYKEEIAVPLVLWSRDGRVHHPERLIARHIDVAPTIADLLGLSGGDVPVQGSSLLRRRDAPPAFASSYFDEVSQALVLGATKYVRDVAGDQLLAFDLAADPDEERPAIVTGERRQSVLRRLQAFDAYQRLAQGE